MHQIVLCGDEQYEELNKWLLDKRVLVVCGKAYPSIVNVKQIVDKHSNIVYFQHYKPNPIYESVLEGVKLFNDEHCDAVMAVGGGSAIDVAKCIRIFSSMDKERDYLGQDIIPNGVPLLVVPTTAGTGSEVTRYAVIYKNEDKQSITSNCCVPDVVLLDPNNLKSLPVYQRKSTMLDALAHSIESMWSINSTDQSMKYSQQALRLFLENKDGYLNNTSDGNKGMLKAAHIAGKAINISQTTAGHAMCYKITSIFGCAHGHAAMLCNRKLLPWMVDHIDQCIDLRGVEHLKNVFQCLSEVLGCYNIYDASDYIQSLYDDLELEIPVPSEEQLQIMIKSVNETRLKNNPIKLTQNGIDMIYRDVFGMG